MQRLTLRDYTSPICGLRYGGSSRTKADGTPFKNVFDKIHDTISVIPTASNIKPRSINADIPDRIAPVRDAVKNIEIREIRVGKRPLQGMKLLVIIAISRSLGESIILQPVTPAALQPNPIAMDNIKPLVIYAYSLLPCYACKITVCSLVYILFDF